MRYNNKNDLIDRLRTWGVFGLEYGVLLSVIIFILMGFASSLLGGFLGMLGVAAGLSLVIVYATIIVFAIIYWTLASYVSDFTDGILKKASDEVRLVVPFVIVSTIATIAMTFNFNIIGTIIGFIAAYILVWLLIRILGFLGQKTPLD